MPMSKGSLRLFPHICGNPVGLIKFPSTVRQAGSILVLVVLVHVHVLATEASGESSAREAIRDPIACLLYLVEKKADPAYRYSALHHAVKSFLKKGDASRALESIERQSKSLRADLYLDFLEQNRHQTTEVVVDTILQRALRDATQTEWPPIKIDRLIRLAHAYVRVGQVWKGLALAQQAEHDLPEIDGQQQVYKGRALAAIAGLYLAAGQKNKADEYFIAARQELLGHVGELVVIAGAYGVARHYDQALSVAEQLGEQQIVAGALLQLAQVAGQNQDQSAALGFLRHAALTVLRTSEPAYRDVADWRSQSLALIASRYVDLGRKDEGFAVAEKIVPSRYSADHLRWLAKLFKRERDNQKAKTLLRQAYKKHDGQDEVSTLLALAGAYTLDGEHDGALAALNRAEASAELRGEANTNEAVGLYTEIAEQYFWLGERDRAFGALQHAVRFGRQATPDWGKSIELGAVTLTLAEYGGTTDQQVGEILAQIVAETEIMQDYGTH